MIHKSIKSIEYDTYIPCDPEKLSLEADPIQKSWTEKARFYSTF